MTSLLESLSGECMPLEGELITPGWTLKWSGQGLAVASREAPFVRHWAETSELSLHLSRSVGEAPNHWLGALLGRPRRVVLLLHAVVRLSSQHRLSLAAHIPGVGFIEGLPDLAVSDCELVGQAVLIDFLSTLRALGSPLAIGSQDVGRTEGHGLHPEVFDETVSSLRKQRRADRVELERLTPLEAELKEHRTSNKELRKHVSALEETIASLEKTVRFLQNPDAPFESRMKTLTEYNLALPHDRLPKIRRAGVICPACVERGVEQELIKELSSSSIHGPKHIYEWREVCCLRCGFRGVQRTD